MNEEFPTLEVRDYQKNFLGDWWSERKLFRGGRQSGKSTLMLCEARRFAECGFDIMFLSPSKRMSKHLRERYHDIFREHPLFDFGSYHAVKNGNMRGYHKDVIICDEFQDIDLQNFNDEIMPMRPSFIRVSACKSRMSHVHYLSDADDGGFFDSVYED